jgi:OOP family OmpA-OmpF porin
MGSYLFGSMQLRRRFDSSAVSGLAAAVILLLLAATAAQAETRVALVIGNGSYKNTSRLANPRNDATDVAAALTRAGFETITGFDLDKAGMEDAEIRFARKARDADVAIFYYSGHAIQYAGTNYLLPVDALIKDSTDLRRLAKVDDIVDDLQQAKTLRVLILDSCRDNPLADELKRTLGSSRGANVQRGLARLDSPRGMIVAYSTQAGQTADDGTGRNSPYTAALLRQIETPEEISVVFKRTAAEVARSGRQLPELSLSFFGDFYLKDPGKAVADPAPPPGPRSTPSNAATLNTAPAAPNVAPAAPNPAPTAPKVALATPNVAPATPNAAPAPSPGGQTAPPPAANLARRPTVAALPPVPPTQALTPVAPGATAPGPRRIDDLRGQRRETSEGGRTVITEPGHVIVVDPSGQTLIRHDEIERFRYGARDIQVQQAGGETRTTVIRPDGSQIITVIDSSARLLRRVRRERDGREIIVIDNSTGDPAAAGGYYVDLPPPVVRIPLDRYIVDGESAPPELIYETMLAPPVERIARRYSLGQIRYSANVRRLMPSIDLDTLTFAPGSWDVAPDQATKLQAIADGLNRAIARNPHEAFLIEGHTDAVGSVVDNLSLSDRRAEAVAELLTRQFQVPAENLTAQGYGNQLLKIPTDGPERQNRRFTIRRITPLLTGGTTSLPPPPPGVATSR